ncbi:hypothetical protein AAGW05_02345 [Arthrobacter sp. LAPM80]|uniref:hypothetical protein n=1 Tax=Arthrobacter sp. LAPM80 TaxID=3141788 RepID=UPI00398AD0C1
MQQISRGRAGQAALPAGAPVEPYLASHSLGQQVLAAIAIKVHTTIISGLQPAFVVLT